MFDVASTWRLLILVLSYHAKAENFSLLSNFYIPNFRDVRYTLKLNINQWNYMVII